jgi:FkbM family methyltransferase
MISYAQNHEDVLLERCFRGQAEGFFIDVGAWDPFDQSVTQHFSARGWRGINVEPVPEYFERLRAARPHDVNLQCVLTEEVGTRSLTVIDDSGLSTICDLNDAFVRDLGRAGLHSRLIEANSSTLAIVCSEYVPDGVDIDFLKVDVEGAEAQVLRGADWQAHRPRVLVIEAMSPVGFDVETGWPMVEDTSEDWEPQLLASGYLFAACDGLNRFYVREEEPDLLSHFGLPANVLDGFVPYATWAADQELARLRQSEASFENRCKSLERELSTLIERLDASSQAARALQVRSEAAEARLVELQASASWRMTAPTRALTDWLRRRAS